MEEDDANPRHTKVDIMIPKGLISSLSLSFCLAIVFWTEINVDGFHQEKVIHIIMHAISTDLASWLKLMKFNTENWAAVYFHDSLILLFPLLRFLGVDCLVVLFISGKTKYLSKLEIDPDELLFDIYLSNSLSYASTRKVLDCPLCKASFIAITKKPKLETVFTAKSFVTVNVHREQSHPRFISPFLPGKEAGCGVV
ncbi:hypothetical protein RND71_011454 [Anisodus tanguticus]|uniref:Transmembrane protein n=1 Tax=Anisodus tanguticus TaxID=243964 RepID=A0AAE1SDI5_9SOLA|nr:hypothetical protein RND71_011454 [Anisodus tanguticus]